ncbi:hypothetical protein KC355_g49 [Hortaea werneckii]|nr:hypothetical protein KC355_g49 [Hortaea werneckii]
MDLTFPIHSSVNNTVLKPTSHGTAFSPSLLHVLPLRQDICKAHGDSNILGSLAPTVSKLGISSIRKEQSHNLLVPSQSGQLQTCPAAKLFANVNICSFLQHYLDGLIMSREYRTMHGCAPAPTDRIAVCSSIQKQCRPSSQDTLQHAKVAFPNQQGCGHQCRAPSLKCVPTLLAQRSRKPSRPCGPLKSYLLWHAEVAARPVHEHLQAHSAQYFRRSIVTFRCCGSQGTAIRHRTSVRISTNQHEAVSRSLALAMYRIARHLLSDCVVTKTPQYQARNYAACSLSRSDRIASPKNSEERGSIQDAAAIDIFPSFSIRDRYRSSCACSNLTKPLWSVWAGSCFGPSMTIFPLPATCFSKSVPTSTIRDVGYETISNGGCRRLSKSANSRVR